MRAVLRPRQGKGLALGRLDFLVKEGQIAKPHKAAEWVKGRCHVSATQQMPENGSEVRGADGRG